MLYYGFVLEGVHFVDEEFKDPLSYCLWELDISGCNCYKENSFA